MYDQAEAVLKEGTRIVQPVDEQAKEHLYGSYSLMSMVAQARGDRSGQLSALEKANDVAGDKHPEIACASVASTAGFAEALRGSGTRGSPVVDDHVNPREFGEVHR
jgi:hypothetical protein